MNSRRKWTKFGLTAIAVLSVLAMAGILYASSGDPQGGSQGPLGIPSTKWWDLLWRALNFSGLVFILVYFLTKPVKEGLRGRRQGIMEQFEDLDAKKSEAEQEYKEYEAKLAGMDDELKKMIDTAIAQGETEKERIIAEANRAADDIKRQADMAVQSAVADAQQTLKADIAEQAALMAEEIIKKNLQDTDQNSLVEDYLTKVGGLK